MDPSRDLAHVAAAADASVTLRAPVDGETLTWSNDRAAGRVRVLGPAWGGFYVCGEVGAIVYGDSGTGLYGEPDGALIAVVVGADLAPGWPRSGVCGGGAQLIQGVAVP